MQDETGERGKYQLVTEIFLLKPEGVDRIWQKQKKAIFEKPAVEKQNGFVLGRSPVVVFCEKGN
jgi:hypothetical protein